MSGVRAYKAGAAARNTDALVIGNAELVKRIAYHLAGRLPASVEVADLIQAGMLGLLEAAANYTADRGASFETYAGIRIRGAMLDALRKLDWAPRSVHRKARAAAAAVREIEASRTGVHAVSGLSSPRRPNATSMSCPSTTSHAGTVSVSPSHASFSAKMFGPTESITTGVRISSETVR